MDIQTLLIAAVAAAIFWADRMGWLPAKKSTADAVAELEVADRKAERLQIALDAALARAKLLEDARLSKPVLDALAVNTQLQGQILERLAAHNGSFKHMEASWAANATAMRDIVNSIQTLSGWIAELHDLPMRGRP
jgi:hypothetical protein